MTLSKERLDFYATTEPPFGYTGGDIQAMARELLERRDRDKQEPAPQIKNLEHFIAFWRKVQGGHILPSKNDIDHTVWFMEGLADIAAPPAPVVPDEQHSERFEWTFKDWAEHLGGRHQNNDPACYYEFGSFLAVAEMLRQFGVVQQKVGWNACRATMLNGGQS